MSEQKELFPTTTENWSNTIEKVIKDIGETCKGYKWMNITAAKTSRLKYNILMYTLITTGPITGILSALNTSDNLSIFVTVFSFLSGILSAIIKFSKFQQKSSSYKIMAAKYASLEGNIRRQLSLNREERVNAGKYLQWVSVSFDDLFASAPLIPDHIYEEWVKFAKNNNLTVPKDYGNMVEIEDNTEKLGSLDNIKIRNSNIEIVVQGTDTIKKKKKRGDIYTSYTDLNKFQDSKMKYELSRLYGFTDN
jgi:hypothetical protein